MEKIGENARRPAVTGGKPISCWISSTATERGDLRAASQSAGIRLCRDEDVRVVGRPGTAEAISDSAREFRRRPGPLRVDARVGGRSSVGAFIDCRSHPPTTAPTTRAEDAVTVWRMSV